MSIFINHRVPEAIFFLGNLVMTTMTGMVGRTGAFIGLDFGLWNQRKLGETGAGIYSKEWIIIFAAGVKTRRPRWGLRK